MSHYPYQVNHTAKLINTINISVAEMFHILDMMYEWLSNTLLVGTYCLKVDRVYFKYEEDLLAFRLAFSI